MRHWLIGLALGILPHVAVGQDIAVRSGEHGDFTRVVIPLPNGADWTLARGDAETSLTLKITGADANFDLSQAFRRIDRARIASMTAGGSGELAISLACDCGADTFVAGGNLLVMDIRPGADLPPAAVSQVASAPEPATLTPAQPNSNPLLSELSRVHVGVAPGLGPSKQPDPLLPRLPARQPSYGTESANLQSEGDSTEAPQPSDLGNQIADDLAAAASAGLLTPAIRVLPGRKPAVQETAVAAPQPSNAPPSTAELAMQLAADLSNADQTSSRGGRVSLGGESCVSDRRLALSSWASDTTGDDKDLNAVLADRRSELFGEFDRVKPAALKEYARALIYSGFGAEARVVLDMDPDGGDRTLVSLSYLVDGMPDPTGVFLGQTECPGPAALWSVLGTSEFTTKYNLDHQSVLRAFEGLPLHLREHLGPLLGEKMEKAGYSETAREIYRRLVRSQGSESDSVALGRAQLDLKAGNLAAAENRLKPLSEQGGPQTPEAIVARVTLAEAKGEKLPERIVDLAGAYANEMRNSAEGAELWQAHVRSLLLNGAFEQAFDALDSAEGIPAQMVADTHETAITYLTSEAEDITFLKLVVPLRQSEPGHKLRDRTMLDIAQRLVGLGMSDPAIEYLDRISDPKSDRDARLIRAAALLDLARPEEAEIHLIGLKGDDVSKLRAEARQQMGDYTFARELYSQLGEEAEASTSAWLSGDWAEVASQSDGILSEAARLIQTDQPVIGAVVPTLADAEMLSDQSASSMETIRSLLAATQVNAEN